VLFSASAPSHHSLSSVAFTTNIAESNFRYHNGSGSPQAAEDEHQGDDKAEEEPAQGQAEEESGMTGVPVLGLP
jgi:hypothetical protein